MSKGLTEKELKTLKSLDTEAGTLVISAIIAVGFALLLIGAVAIMGSKGCLVCLGAGMVWGGIHVQQDVKSLKVKRAISNNK